MTDESASPDDNPRAPLRVLFLGAGDASPTAHNRFHAMSAALRGDVIVSRQGPNLRSPAGLGYTFGKFRYFEFAVSRRLGMLRAVTEIARYVRTTAQLMRAGADYDVIVAFGFFTASLAGVILKVRYRRKLLIEVPIVPGELVRHRKPRTRLAAEVGATLHKCAVALTLRCADHMKLVFEGQVDVLPREISAKPHHAFPDFTPTSCIVPCEREDHVLVIGTPLHLKGADLAIRAFLQLRQTFPDERLLIVGSAQGHAPLRKLAGPLDCIDIIDYVPHDDALELIRCARVVVIASRTEAMPRVAVEAMSAAKAIVASAVGGLPHYLRHADTAMLCERENVADLAEKLSMVLADASLRRRLGCRARQHALECLSEDRYVRQYADMLDECVARGARHAASTRATYFAPDDTDSAA